MGNITFKEHQHQNSSAFFHLLTIKINPFREVIYITIIDRYRRKRDRLVELAAGALIPAMWGPFKAYCYRSLLDGIEHIAMVKVSISSACSPPSSVSYLC